MIKPQMHSTSEVWSQPKGNRGSAPSPFHPLLRELGGGGGCSPPPSSPSVFIGGAALPLFTPPTLLRNPCEYP